MLLLLLSLLAARAEDPLPDPPVEALLPQIPLAPLTPATLSGRILERGSGLPLVATITGTAKNSDLPRISATTDAKGEFSLVLPPGTWELTLEEPDHLGITAVETVAEGEVVSVEYRLDRVSWDAEITVYGEEQREEVSRRVISAEELQLIPGSFGDPIRALQSLPGVARPATLEGDIVVRGAEGINTGTYIDEIPVPYLFHFFIGRSVVNPALLDDVEFYAGGMPSRFGDVTQAVVNARTLDTKPKPGFHGRVSADLLDFAVSGEGRITKQLTFQAGYRVSWIGALIGTGARVYTAVKGLGDFRPPYPTLSYEDHLFRLAWKDGPDRVMVTELGARDAFIFHPPKYDIDGDGDVEELPLPPGLPYDPYRLMDSGFQRLQVRWDREVDGRDQVTWIAAGPDRESSLLEGIGLLADGVDFGKIKGWTIRAKRQDRFPLGDNAIRSGVDLAIEPVDVQDYRQLDDAGNVPTTRETRLSLAGWGEFQYDLGKTFLAPGFRLGAHHFNDRTFVQPEPRMTLRTPLEDHWTATAFLGRFSQVPPADRYADGIGNPNLGIMTAWQSSFGVEGRYPSGIEVDLTVYASQMGHLVVKDQEVQITPDQNLDPENPGPTGTATAEVIPVFREVTGYAFGLETMFRIRPNGPWFGWVTASIGKSLRVDSEGTVRPGDYDLPISVTLVAARELPWDFRISGKVRVTSGYPFTPLYPVYNSEYDYWSARPGEENSDRFPWYRQIDARIDRTWTGDRARWTLYLDVFNTTNTKNWFLASYDPTYQKLTPTIYIPIIPTLGLEVRY